MKLHPGEIAALPAGTDGPANGGRQAINIDTRVVAATNADLHQAIHDGRFREDLYFRLAVIVIHLPPLRERGDDVTLLATEFLYRYAAQIGKKRLAFAPDALHALYWHSWPGNVRELQNRVKRAVIMTEGKRMTVDDLELTESSNTSRATLKEAREAVEKEVVTRALTRLPQPPRIWGSAARPLRADGEAGD